MKPINLHVASLQPGANFVQVGIPYPQGVVTDSNTLLIQDPNGNPLDISVQAISLWPDGTVKWCLAKIALLNCQTLTTDLTVSVIASKTDKQQALVNYSNTDKYVEVSSGNTTFKFTTGKDDSNSFFPSVTVDSKPVWQKGASYPTLTTIDGTQLDFDIKNISVVEQTNVVCKIEVSGAYRTESKQALNARFLFEVLPEAQLSLTCTLHNPQRATHPGGIWDLGDPGSFNFRDFSLVLQQPSGSVSKIKPEPDSDWIEAKEPTVLFQASSGGDNWNCSVHKNAGGHVGNQFCGYQITSNNQTLHNGQRSSPVLAVTDNDNLIYTVQTQNFWQNFPKSIDVDLDNTQLRLFPHHHGDTHEIQGGERKTHRVLFNFSHTHRQADTLNAAANPVARVDPSAYKNAGVFSYFENTLQDSGYDGLINAPDKPKSGFLAKRELIDEYGWRNFGEVYADHEAAYYQGSDPYISHYNNQYDSVYGFARQYALTGDSNWQTLMDDLAKHVMDIDIYRTDKDRAEYNNGLFWHTDHYVQAHTGTHRTYSSAQIDKHGNPPAGGGPGPQHCYTTGLTYYYFMTGDEEAKKTVLGLTEWIQNYYEGTGTVLEAAHKTLREDTASLIQTCKGAKIFKYRYPMDRGTGNYIRALLDSFELTNDEKHLQQVEMIIKSTAGPQDDFKARNLDDIEFNWWYVVFLQEVIRYLDVKRMLDQHDSNFYYARSTLLYYADWMVTHDKPFLESADRLEYPNDTWTAQESRKIHVLFAAYKYALKDRSKYLERARFYRDYVTQELSKSDTLHFSRIQVLLMQNHGPASCLNTDSLPYPGMREISASSHENCFHTPATQLKTIAGTWMKSVMKFRISNELRWIKSRAS